MRLSADQLPTDTTFAQEISLSIDPEDEHGIDLSEPHVKGMEQALIDAGIGGFSSKVCIESESGNLHAEYEILIPGENCNAEQLINAVRGYLDKNSIDWHEPYAMPEQDGDFQFLLPYLSVYK